MREQMEKRLQELRTEFECGQKMLAELEAKQANIRDSLLRLSGAIQVSEELLEESRLAEEDGARSLEPPLVSSPLYKAQNLRERTQARLEELKKEFETGQLQLRDSEMQHARLRETLLRISGAIQVLEELRAEVTADEQTEVRSLQTPPVST